MPDEKALEALREGAAYIEMYGPDALAKRMRTAIASYEAETGETHRLIEQLWGSLNFILAFYEPGQRYLDTEAWKQAEASGRRAHKAAREWLDAAAPLPEQEPRT